MKISKHLPPPPKPTILVQARVDAQLIRDLRAKLFRKNITMVDFIAACAKSYLDEKD